MSTSKLEPLTAVVLVNFDTEGPLLNCLASLEEFVNSELMIIIIDNSPEPSTAEITRQYPRVIVRYPGENLGFAGACNDGIGLALQRKAERILLLNPDTVVEDDFLQPLHAVLDQESTVGAATPQILEADTREIWYAGGRINFWFGGPQHVRQVNDPADAPWSTVPFASACALLLKAEAVRRVGPMHEGYFLYFEDADYVQRLLEAGYRVAYVPRATVMHQVSASIDRGSPHHAYLYSRSRIWFMREWADAHQLVGFVLFTALVKVPVALVVLAVVRRKPGLAFAFVQGSLDGIRTRLRKGRLRFEV